MSDEDLLLFLLLQTSDDDPDPETPPRKRQKIWVRDDLEHRPTGDGYTPLLREASNDPEEFHSSYRMSPERFDELLNRVAPRLRERGIDFRTGIPEADQLAVTLKYLASGMSQQDVAWFFRMGESTVCRIIPQVCHVLWNELAPLEMPPPDTRRWRDIAQEFQYGWNFPHCIGAVDGKYVNIHSPRMSGSASSSLSDTRSIRMSGSASSSLSDTRSIRMSGSASSSLSDTRSIRMSGSASSSLSDTRSIRMSGSASSSLSDTRSIRMSGSASSSLSDTRSIRMSGSACSSLSDTRSIRMSGSACSSLSDARSSVLLAVADADYAFTYVDVGAYSGESDASIYTASDFGKRLEAGSLQLPNARDGELEYVFIGDEAFPLRPRLMRPHPDRPARKLAGMGESELHQQRVYNYRLNRARGVVDNAFGILMSKWRVLRQPIEASVDTAHAIVRATCVLHNFLRHRDGVSDDVLYIAPGDVDADEEGRVVRGAWRQEISGNGLTDIGRLGSNNASKTVQSVRELFERYFVSPEGRVPWQDGIV